MHGVSVRVQSEELPSRIHVLRDVLEKISLCEGGVSPGKSEVCSDVWAELLGAGSNYILLQGTLSSAFRVLIEPDHLSQSPWGQWTLITSIEHLCNAMPVLVSGCLGTFSQPSYYTRKTITHNDSPYLLTSTLRGGSRYRHIHLTNWNSETQKR